LQSKDSIVAAEPTREVDFLFPTVIKTLMLPDAEALNARLVAAIEDLRARVPGQVPDSWSCDLYTTFQTENRLHELDGFKELDVHIRREADAFARDLELDLGNAALSVRGCWVNIYGAGHSQEIHVHANNLISGVYYVQAPPGVPGLMIHSPFAEEMISPKTTEQNPANLKFAEIEATAGRMALFRSWTRHSVRPNHGQGERVSIAFNLGMAAA
jgi:uncharacterized protein (TIGR02466 family)